jgi:hypothetical protein
VSRADPSCFAAINVTGYGVGIAALAFDSPIILTASFGFTAYAAYMTYRDYNSKNISLLHASANGIGGALNVAGIVLANASTWQAKSAGIVLGGLGRSIDTMNFSYSLLPE